MSPQVNRRGRPSVSPKEASTDVHLTMSDSLYDQAYQRAAQQRVSVPEVIRRALVKDLETQNRRS
jgi:predicted HicB family RNase H-like nuclease